MWFFKWLRVAFLFALLVMLNVQTVNALPIKAPAQTPATTQTARVSATWVEQAKQHIAEREYYISPNDKGLQAPNRQHDFRAYFALDGMKLEPRNAVNLVDNQAPNTSQLSPSLHLQFHSLRRQLLASNNLSQPPTANHEKHHNASHIRYQHNQVNLIHGNGITEWYINDERGLEHGFELQQPLQGEGPLVLTMNVPIGEVKQKGDKIQIRLSDNRIMDYKKLLVLDADKQLLPAKLVRVSPSQLQIHFDDTHARYPILVDPILTNAADIQLTLSAAISNSSDYFGFSVDGAGDVNGDGYDDVIVGANAFDNGQSNEGAVFVYHGGVNGISTNYSIKLEGNSVNSRFGYSVAGAGDVNNDGFDDVIIGAAYFSGTNSTEGAAYIFLGSASGVNSSYSNFLDSNSDTALFGSSVDGAGDVNGDGFDDVIVGAPYYDNVISNGGAVYLFHGNGTGVNNTPAKTWTGDQLGGAIGLEVAGIGDVNNDGYDDVASGSNLYNSGDTDSGIVYVYYGSASGASATADFTVSSAQDDGYLGVSITDAGDVNNDGFADMLIGESGYRNGELAQGRIHLYYGSGTGLSANSVTTIAQNTGFGHFGNDADAAGDINGDGYGDVIIGSYGADSAFVYFGSSTGIKPNLSYQIAGATAGRFAISVAGIGDMNNDGYSDVIVGDDYHDVNFANDGIAFIYRGSTAAIIDSASYDHSAGTLVVTGVFAPLTGADNDVVVTNLTLTGESGVSHTLSGSSVELDNASQFTVSLSASDKTIVNGLFNKDGTSSDTVITAYNLSVADNFIAAVTAGDTSDSSTAITVSNYTPPTIISATYDYNTGVLAVTGSHFVNKNGALNDVDVSKLSLVGLGGGSYTLTTSNVEITSESLFSVSLNASDKTAVNALLNFSGTQASDQTTYNLNANEDWMSGAGVSAVIVDASGNGITVSNAPSPSIDSAEYDISTGTLVVTGRHLATNTGADNDITVSALTLHGAANASYTLTGNGVELDSDTQFTLTFSGLQRATIAGLLNKNGTSSDDGVTYNLAVADDFNTPITDGDTADATNVVTVINYVAPTISSASYDDSNGTLVVTGTQLVTNSTFTNDISVSLLTVTGENNTSYTLTSTNVNLTSDTSFTINLNATDVLNLRGLLNKNGLISDGGTSYNLAAADNWLMAAPSSVDIGDLTANSITVSNTITPSVTAATYDSATGVLAVTATDLRANLGAANDIDVTKLSITGQNAGSYTFSSSANVDVDSATGFSVTLSSSDKLVVDGLLNKNGTSADDGTVYNLAAAEDWLIGAAASSTIADLTANGIVVSNVIVPTLSTATYNATTGQLVVTATGLRGKTGAANDVDVSMLTIEGDGSASYTLTATTDVDISSATEFSLTLNDTDRLVVDGLLNLNGASAGDGSVYNLAAADGWLTAAGSGSSTADLSGNVIIVSQVTVPTITSGTYDMATGILSVTGSHLRVKNGVDNDVDVSMLTIHGQAGNSHQLTTTTDVELTSNSAFNLTLSGEDKLVVDGLLNNTGNNAADGAVYNLAGADNWLTAAASSSIIADLTNNGITVSNLTVPSITSATYDHTTGALVVSGVNLRRAFGSLNDVDVTKLSLVGLGGNGFNLTGAGAGAGIETGIEITSATQFSLTLSEADKLHVNGLLHLAGNSAQDSVAYNLAAADDWQPSVLTATNIADLVANGVLVSNVTPPSISQVSYDAQTGLVTVEGAGFVKHFGDGNDIDVTQFTFVGADGLSYTLQVPVGVELSASTGFSFILSDVDLAAVNRLFNANGNGSGVYNVSVADNWLLGASGDISDTSNGLTVSNVPVPTITAVNYNAATGSLQVIGSHFIAQAGDNNDIDVSAFTLTGQGGREILLTGDDVEITSDSEFSIVLRDDERLVANAILNLNGQNADDGTAYNLAVADDFMTQFSVGDTSRDTNALTVTHVTAAQLISAQYDAATGVMLLTASNLAAIEGLANDIVANTFTLTGQAGQSYTLTDTANVDVTSLTNATLTLSATDKFNVNGLLNLNGSSADDGTLYNVALADNWLGGAAQSLDISDANNGISVSNVTIPTITSARYDGNSGVLAVTGTNLHPNLALTSNGAGNDITVTNFTILGQGGQSHTLTTNAVEITDESSFTVNLNASDQQALAVLLNKLGSSAIDGTTYNLAASGQWLAAGASSVDMSDLTANNIDVLSVKIPTLSLAVSNPLISEPDDSANVNISTILSATISSPSVNDVVIDLSFAGTASLGIDYSSLSQLTIPAGQTSASLTLTAIADAIFEGAGGETVIIDVATVPDTVVVAAGQTLTQIITIAEVDTAPMVALSVSETRILEANTPINVAVSLSVATTDDVTVTLALSGSADGSDYQGLSAAPNPVLVISAGQLSASTTLTIVADEQVESDETIIIDIASVTGDSASELGEQQQTITIINDDSALVSLSADVLELVEASGVSQLTVTMDKPSFEAVIIDLSSAGNATLGIDYVLAPSRLTIEAGQISASALLTVTDDSTEEPDETVQVRIAQVTGGGAQSNGEQSITAIILNDDDETAPSRYQVSFDHQTVNLQNHSNIGFTLSQAEVGSQYQYTLSDSTTGMVKNGSIDNSGTVTTPNFSVKGIDVSGLADGALTLSVSLTDSSANQGEVITATVQKDATPPSYLWDDNVPAQIEEAFALSLRFNEAVTGLTLDDFSATNGTLSQLQGSGQAYSLLVTPLDEGQLSVSLPADKVQDAFDNNNLAGADFSRQYIPPIVVLESLTPANNDTLVALDSPLTIVFDRDVLPASTDNLIEVRKRLTDEIVASFASDSASVVIAGSTATITPSDLWPRGEQVYVTVAAGAFVSTKGRFFAGFSDSSTWQFTVFSPVPVTVADSATVDEENRVQIDVLANDRSDDSELNPASVQVTVAPTHGQTTLNTANGVITYTPNQHFYGEDSFSYRVGDIAGGSSDQTLVSIVVNNVNDTPQAVDDVALTDEDTSVLIHVLANDFDADGADDIDPSAIVVSRQASNGTVSLHDGQLLYLPNADFNGADSFAYQAVDKAGAVSNEATVTVNIGSTNDAPRTSIDLVSTVEDVSIDIAVLDNDSDVDGSINASSLTIVALPQTGGVVIDNAIVRYTPGPNFNGSDSFKYSVNDDLGLASAATDVVITITGVDDVPFAANDIVMVVEDVNLQINPVGNDVAGDAPISAIEVVSAPEFGQVNVDNNGLLLRYLPGENYFGFDRLTYVLIDSLGGRSNEATIELIITPVNDAPLVNNDVFTINEDQVQALAVLDNDQDVDGQFMLETLAVHSAPSHGTAVVNLDGTITYTPELNFNGQDNFVYSVQDDLRAEGQGTVTINVTAINDAPIGKDMGIALSVDSDKNFTLVGRDAEGDLIDYIIVSQPQNGSLFGTAPTITYQPNNGFVGTDSFEYRLQDHQDSSPVYTVTARVGLANAVPIANDMLITTAAQTPVLVALDASDPDGDSLTFTLPTEPQNGSLSGIAPTMIYTPNPDFSGIEQFSFSASDGILHSDVATVTIRVGSFNTLPVAIGQSVSGQEDSAQDIVLQGIDEDGDALQYRIVSLPSHGSLVGPISGPMSDGLAPITYRPDSDYHGSDEIIVLVNDGHGDSQPVAIDITVTPVNDAPTALDGLLTVNEDQLGVFTLQGADVDGDTLSFAITQAPVNGEVSIQGKRLFYTPNDDFNGSDILSFVSSDGVLSSNAVALQIAVTPVNDAPLAVDDAVTVTQWSASDIDVLANDIDVDLDTLYIVGASSNIGTVEVNQTSISYTPIEGFLGQASIDYMISDSQNRTSEGKVLVNVDVNTDGLPVLTVPADIELNAQGLLTQIQLGTASAVDSQGNPIPAVLLSNKTHFKPGHNTVLWLATDDQGLSSMRSSQVIVHPLVSLTKPIYVMEGQTVTVDVELNGLSPVYPLTIDYQVSGTSTLGADHTLSSGSIDIESGMSGQIQFEVLTDSDIEADETVVISLSDGLNRGAIFTQTITITEQDITPTVAVILTQDNQQRYIVNQQQGIVSAQAVASHPDPNKQFSYQWTDVSGTLLNTSDESNRFSFEPAGVATGVYQLALTLTDSENPQLLSHKVVTIELQQNPIALSDIDTDGDGLSDAAEGLGDADNDGIANYLDNVNQCNVLVSEGGQNVQHLIETEAGVCMRLGRNALLGDTGGALLNEVGSDDVIATNIGGLFDFEIQDLAVIGQNVKVVLPQLQPVPPNGVYRKQLTDGSWQNFVEGEHDSVWSAFGTQGYCPPPGAVQWVRGLLSGSWCVQLQLSDGGPNDNDGVANGRIVDPGGVGSVLGDNQLPVAVNDNAAGRINTSVSIDVLANDSDPDGDNLTIMQAQTDFGQVAIVAGSLHYQPPVDYIGENAIIYTISDGANGTATAKVAMSITPNVLPVAQNDYVDAVAGQSITFTVLNNDTDAENDPLTVIAASATHGTVTIASDNRLTYLVNADFSGLDTIQYSIKDSYGGSATASVTVTVSKLDQAKPTQTVDTSAKGGAIVWMFAFIILLGYRRRMMIAKF